MPWCKFMEQPYLQCSVHSWCLFSQKGCKWESYWEGQKAPSNTQNRLIWGTIKILGFLSPEDNWDMTVICKIMNIMTTVQCIFQFKNQGILNEANMWQVHRAQTVLLTICYHMNFITQVPATDMRSSACLKSNWTYFLD